MVIEIYAKQINNFASFFNLYVFSGKNFLKLMEVKAEMHTAEDICRRDRGRITI